MARQDQANDQFSVTSFLYGGNADYIEQLHAAYQEDPDSVDPEWRDFFALTKPRVMTLVIFTAICGVLAAPGHIHPVLGFTAILAIAYIAALLGLFLGWAKLAEPKYSLVCDAEGVRYQHRSGSWCLPWSAFSYCAVPSIDGKSLAYIGFKVTNIDALLAGLGGLRHALVTGVRVYLHACCTLR